MTIALLITFLFLTIIGATVLIWYLYQHQYFLPLLSSQPFSPPINKSFMLLPKTHLQTFISSPLFFPSLFYYFMFSSFEILGFIEFILLDPEIFQKFEMFLLYHGGFAHIQQINP